ncbi:MAG: trypsin-like peptidase domain-containing protein [Candidatus Izemoplasmatales bacterium]|nr:trypsin-like peptidase domain-containing protein [Candidatus Izemoplasmatales bacterium]
MKKIFILIGLMGIVASMISCDQLIFTQITGATTSTVTASTSSSESTYIPTTTESSGEIEATTDFSYANYQDLIDQLADNIRSTIGDDLDQYMNHPGESIASDESVYQEIYLEVESRLREEFLENTSGSIPVNLDSIQEKILEVSGIAEHSIVGITSYFDLQGQALGSGVIYKYDAVANIYFVITNHHVIEDGNNFKIVFYEGSKVTAYRLGYDSDVDVAVLYFNGDNLPIVPTISVLGDSDAAEAGNIVIAGGNPRGYDFYGSVTLGIVSGVNRDVENPKVLYIQHDASINSGNSGGPLYNLEGEVIGINVLKYASEDIEGMGFAIPINQIKTMLAEMEEGAPTT